ncbi:alpha/beta hydrolase [Kitasatospora paranensis]|uniref:Alpha/beta hydrolase n=1 Tax=Kitasatospora paranensis TaxID=258053 RepID=A0ABW2FNV5_9ACTN
MTRQARPTGSPAADEAPYEEFRIPVAGGKLTVLRWPARLPDAPVVLALHGITANALSWARVAHHLAGRVVLVAPDLRGRAGSADVEGPWGIGAHVEDVLAVMDALGLGRAVLAGHSMGAFVAARTAARHPGRVTSLVLVDGGLGFPAPPGLDGDELITAVIGPAMRRLSMTFPDRAAYRAFWQAHPAFGAVWSPWVDAYIQRDLVGGEPELRSSCRIDAVRADGIQLFDAETLDAIHRLDCPAELLWAERGLMDEPQGLYDPQRLADAALDGTGVVPVPVPETNHYTILVADDGAGAVADRIATAAGPPAPRP